MSTDKNQTNGAVSGGRDSRSRNFTKWLRPKHWVNLFESSFHARDMALVVLGAEVGFVTSTLGFLSAILGGLGVFIFLCVLVALNACIAGYLIYKVMYMGDDLKSDENSSVSGVTGIPAEN